MSLLSPAYAEEEYVAILIRVIEGATNSGATNSSQPNQAGSSGHLGMYVPSDFAGQPGSSQGLAIWGGGFAASSGGWVVDRTLGGVTTVTKTPSVHDTFSYGGIYGVYDASRFVPANQSLSFFGTVDIAQNNFTFGPEPGEGVNSQSDQFDLNILAGEARWSIDNVYLKGTGMAIFGDGRQFYAFDEGIASFSTALYAIDATLGEVFDLYNTSSVTPSAVLPTKAPSRTTNGDHGYMLGLDLSGHVGYVDGVLISGFTDSAGFTQGNLETKFAMLGAAAKLFATIPGDKFQWKPYVSAAVDDYPGFSFIATIPAQPLLPTGEVVTLLPAPTFWTGELGLDVQNDLGWTFGIRAIYMASSDTIIRYASAHLKIPFNFAPLVATRYSTLDTPSLRANQSEQ